MPRGLYLLSALVALTACGSRPDAVVRSPYVTVSDFDVARAGPLEARFRLPLHIQNPNPFPLPVIGLDYRLDRDQHTVARGVSRNALTIPAFGAANVIIDALGSRCAPHLAASGDAQYRITGGLHLEGVRIPFEHESRLNRGGDWTGQCYTAD